MAEAQNQSNPSEPKKQSLSEIAQQAFGGNFHGEVKPAGPLGNENDEPASDDATPASDDDAGIDAGAAGDSGEGEGEGNDKHVEGDDAASDDASADDGGDEVASVGELIATMEADPEWFQGLQVDVKVNGQTSQVPFRDLVASYQTNQAAEAKLEQAKTKSQEAQQAFQQRNAALEAQFATAGQIITEAEKVLLADMEAIDWKTLHEEDPAAWSAEKVKFNERKSQLAQLKQALVQQYQQGALQRQQELQGQQQEHVAAEIEALNEQMPKVSADWGNPQTLPAAKARLSDYLLRSGFTQDDINNAYDHRLLIMAEKARLHDEAKVKVDVTKKRIRKVPKVMKPGAPKDAGQANVEQVQNAQRALRKSGALDDAVALLRAKRKG